MTLAMERARRQDSTDLGGEHRIGQRPAWPPALPVRLRFAMPVDARPGHPPDAADPGQAIGLAAARRERPAHRLDLLWAKGRPLSSRAILASSSSRSSSISPSRALSRSLSSTSPVAGRVARLASPAARKASRQPLSVAAVTPSERETVSRSSPRSSRRTASRLRWRDMRPPRPGPAAPVVSVVIVTPPRTGSANGASQPTVGRRTSFGVARSEEHTSELQSRQYLVCRLLLDKKETARMKRYLFSLLTL